MAVPCIAEKRVVLRVGRGDHHRGGTRRLPHDTLARGQLRRVHVLDHLHQRGGVVAGQARVAVRQRAVQHPPPAAGRKRLPRHGQVGQHDLHPDDLLEPRLLQQPAEEGAGAASQVQHAPCTALPERSQDRVVAEVVEPPPGSAREQVSLDHVARGMRLQPLPSLVPRRRGAGQALGTQAGVEEGKEDAQVRKDVARPLAAGKRHDPVAAPAGERLGRVERNGDGFHRVPQRFEQAADDGFARGAPERGDPRLELARHLVAPGERREERGQCVPQQPRARPLARGGELRPGRVLRLQHHRGHVSRRVDKVRPSARELDRGGHPGNALDEMGGAKRQQHRARVDGAEAGTAPGGGRVAWETS